MVRTAFPFCGSVEASTRPVPTSVSDFEETASSCPPGLPASCSSKACSSPETPVSEPGGKPLRVCTSACDRVGVPTSPTTAEAPLASTRAAAGPLARGVRSAARIGARGGARVRRLRRSSLASPG